MKKIKDFFISLFTSTEKKKLKAALALTEQRYRSLLQNCGDTIVTMDDKGIYEYVSDGALPVLGIPPKELIGKKLFDFIHDKDKERVYDSFIQLKAIKRIKILPFRFRHKDGSFLWLEAVLTNLSGEPAVNGIAAHLREAKDQVAASERIAGLLKTELDIRNFARHQNNLLEEERSRIARVIHDQFGQQLAGIKMSLSSLLRSNDADTDSTGVVKSLIRELDNTMQSLRKFATELRPGILDTLGLVSSIEWLIEEFENKTGIKFQVHINVKDDVFEKDVSTCFFRVCQEALTNILKHADATEVIAHLTQRNGELKLTIGDNGKGMAGEKLDHPFSMGILGMKERANLVGARLSIKSEHSGGTMIILTTKINGH